MSPESKHIFSIKKLECQRVVVFRDRAEIRRVIKTELVKGENQIILNSVTNSIDKDSVRIEGHGDACVLDVLCQTKSVDTDKLEKGGLLNEIYELEKKYKETKLKLERIIKLSNVFNDFANTMSKPTSGLNNNESGSNLMSSKDNLNNFLSFIDVYSTKLEYLDHQRIEIENEIKDLDEKLKVAKETRMRLGRSQNQNQSVEIIILIEANSDKAHVNLVVSYIVNNASWSPKYDIRAFSKEKSMTINYFGEITQSTGEDWKDARLSLSTAIPSIGGNVPELSTQNVRVKQPLQVYPTSFTSIRDFRFMKDVDTIEACSLPGFRTEGLIMPIPEIPEIPIQIPSSETQTNLIGSTITYQIQRKATIPSDSSSHKVLIGVLNLKTEFEYETVPKINLNAYIKAKVTNTSKYELLAGQANVFFDNNFVTKTDIKSYSPQEEFVCSLGIDPSIRIDYKPIRKSKEQSDLTSKIKTTTYTKVIEIKNTTQNKAKILLSENLPLSSDDKLQVRLLEPVLKDRSNVKLNKSNNLEFDLAIEPSKTETITIKYAIDNSSDKEIEFF